jgi:hypothetical protein
MDELSKKVAYHPDEYWDYVLPLSNYMGAIRRMLEKKPVKRPSAMDLVTYWDLTQRDNRSWCCDVGPDELEATLEECPLNEEEGSL